MNKKINAQELYERFQESAVNFSRLTKYTKISRQHMQYGLEHAEDYRPYLANLRAGLRLMVSDINAIIRDISDELSE